MPTYEFRCPVGHDFEKLYRTISGAESQAVCPVCGALAERIMSAAGFAFKGSGFYLTDYGKDAHRTKGPAEAKPSGAGENGASASGTGSNGSASKSESGSADSKPAESKSSESKGAESKPAAPAPKPSASE